MSSFREGKEASLVIALKEKVQASREMVFVKGGTFTMGDTFGDGDSDETRQRGPYIQEREHRISCSAVFEGSEMRYECRPKLFYSLYTGASKEMNFSRRP
jgi:hypothetical protein